MIRLFLTMCLLPLILRAELNGNNDHGFWFDQYVYLSLPHKTTFMFNPMQRWGDNYKKFWDREYEFNLIHDVTSWLKPSPASSIQEVSFAIGYLFLQELRTNTKGVRNWASQNRAIAFISLTHKFGEWVFKQRFRGQYDYYITKYNPTHGNFRYRIQIFTPWTWTSLRINPYLSNEWFFRNNTYHESHPSGLVGGYHQNRLRLGITFDIIQERITADTYWQLRSTKQRPQTHPRWFNQYIWGLGLSFFY